MSIANCPRPADRKPLAEASILIVGLARDCEAVLAGEIGRLLKAFSCARSLRVLVIESDSSDGTVNVLANLAEQDARIAFRSLGDLAPTLPERSERIAHCRNEYLRCIREDPCYHDVDYVVMADLDGVNALLTAEAVSSLDGFHQWDVCAANQLGPYYDIWALRHATWCPTDCWRQFALLRRHGMSYFRAWTGSILSKMIRIDPAGPWLEVDSAFGGLAIYRRPLLEDVWYDGRTEDGEALCEHVPFHEELLRRGSKIFINPALINAGVVGHAEYATSLGYARFWFRCFLRRFRWRNNPWA